MYICSESLFLSYYLCHLQVYNKVDQISIEEVDRLARRANSAVIRSDICLFSWLTATILLFSRMQEVHHLFLSTCMFQLWDEVEPGLPSGDVVGIPGPDLHLH